MADRQSTCRHCGAQFSFAIGRGTDRKFCGPECARSSVYLKIRASKASYPQCTVDGCLSQVRSAKASMCETHYCRMRRTGSLSLATPAATITHSHGYLLEFMPDHWLSIRSNQSRIYQHRRVYFDAHGEGPFNCNWCGIPVTWGDMHVDHVNAVRDDNSEGNLVASCPACNQARGHAKMKATHQGRSTAKVEWRGETLTLGQWANRVGVTRASMAFRLKAGWPVDRMMTETRGKRGPASRASYLTENAKR